MLSSTNTIRDVKTAVMRSFSQLKFDSEDAYTKAIQFYAELVYAGIYLPLVMRR